MGLGDAWARGSFTSIGEESGVVIVVVKCCCCDGCCRWVDSGVLKLGHVRYVATSALFKLEN